MSIVTDSSGERSENVYAIHRLLKSEAELTPLYEENKGKYKNLKDTLATDLNTFLAPMREKRASITDDDVRTILKEGSEKARTRATAKMDTVRRSVGITL
jgi:tryptophanyl-tRNA synthetase